MLGLRFPKPCLIRKPLSMPSLDEKPGDRHLEFAYCSDTLSVLRKVTAGNPSGLFLGFVLPYR